MSVRQETASRELARLSPRVLLAPGSPLSDGLYRLLAGARSRDRALRGSASGRAVASALKATALARGDTSERLALGRLASLRPSLIAAAAEASESTAERTRAEREADVAHAAKWMSLPPVLGELLFRIVRELRPSRCLELGTGFGLSTVYQASALELNGAGSITSLDIPGMTRMADATLRRAGVRDRVELVDGRIEETLAGAVAASAPVDYALLDADHTEDATLAAFEVVRQSLAPTAVVVVDDINWTPGMGRAWHALRERGDVSAAVDLRRLGILVLSPRVLP